MAKMNTEKRKEYVARLTKKSGEPGVDLDNYMTSLNAALAYYNTNFDNKTKRRWAIEHINGIDQVMASDINRIEEDFQFRSFGTVARILANGNVLQDKELKWFSMRLAELKNLIPIVKSVVVDTTPKVVVPTVQDHILNKAREICAIIDGEIDEFVAAGCPKEFKFSVTSKAYNAPIAKHLIAFYKDHVAELAEVLDGKDEQLNEGYGNFKRMELKRFHSLLESFVADAEQVTKTVFRKPRARKAKPAAEIVKRLKFKVSDEDYGIQSVSPYKIVGASELWVFNTKYKKLQVYRAIDNDTLTVKGTSVLNYNTVTTQSKTLRKPELVGAYAKLGKRTLNTTFKDLTTKPTTPNGRINEECILLAVF